MKIGVLALQGDFHRHLERLKEMNVSGCEVRKPEALENCQGLIIPGGESTTLAKLMHKYDLFEAIKSFNRQWPVFGTCAGAILVSRSVVNQPVDSMNLIDMEIERNAYGRQIDSFADAVTISTGAKAIAIEGVFIRAPKIISFGDSVKAVGHYGTSVVMVENDNVLAATFHPELSDSHLVHNYFLDKIRRRI